MNYKSYIGEEGRSSTCSSLSSKSQSISSQQQNEEIRAVNLYDKSRCSPAIIASPKLSAGKALNRTKCLTLNLSYSECQRLQLELLSLLYEP